LSLLSDDFDTRRHSNAQAVLNVMMVNVFNFVLAGNDQNVSVSLRYEIKAPTLGGRLSPVGV